MYFLFGRFIYKRRKKRRTRYAVTNKRILIMSDGAAGPLDTLGIDEVTNIEMSLRPDGIGTLRFGPPHRRGFSYQNTGLDGFDTLFEEKVPSFFDIHNAEEVYELLASLRRRTLDE